MVDKKDPKSNLKPYQKGVSGNPGGRPSLPMDIRQARSLNRIEFQRLLNECLTFDRDTMKARLDDPASTMLELAVCNIVNKAAREGDQQRLTFVIEHLLGKVIEQVEVSNTYHHLSTVELISLGEEAIKTLKGEVKE